MDDNAINVNINDSHFQIKIDINDDHLIETCFWNVVNVYAYLKSKLFIVNVVVNVMHISLYCM